MSPGGTMMRVYANLKRRIMHGEFAAGTRLDPARLRSDLAASTTPIRDALHRLTGEGLVESWQNEGFRIAYLSEPELRDQYGWSRALTHFSLAAASSHSAPDLVDEGSTSDYPEGVTRLLQNIVLFSPNHEVRQAMRRLCDRAHHYRETEHSLLLDADSEIEALETEIAQRNWRETLGLFDQFHDRRIEIVPDIISLLRERGSLAR